jgi:transposase
VNRETLLTLSSNDLVSLILAQAAQIEAQAAHIALLTVRFAEFEAKLGAPPNTPDNSSTLPSQGQKPNLPGGRRSPRRSPRRRRRAGRTSRPHH